MYQPLSSTLEQIKDKLQGVLDRIEAVGYTENSKDAQAIFELMDEIQDAVTDYQVSGCSKPFLCLLTQVNLIQMAHQQAIYIQNLILIVSPWNG